MSSEVLLRIQGGEEIGHINGPLRLFGWQPGEYGADHHETHPGNHQIFGNQQLKAPTWKIWLRTLVRGQNFEGNSAATRSAVAAFITSWRRSLNPGEDVALSYRVANEWRRVYGRPGKIIMPTFDYLADLGRADIQAEFLCSDPNHYSDIESKVTVGIVPAETSGFAFPFTWPLLWATSGSAQSRAAEVGGDAPAPVRVTFTGPITNPWVQVGTMRLELNGTLAYDETVTIDSRTFTVTKQTGNTNPVSAVEMLDPRTRLTDLRLQPGTETIQFGGVDKTGTARCEVAWRNTYRSI